MARNNPTLTVIAREYCERVRKKSFIITTLLMPLLLVLLAALPTLIMIGSGPSKSTFLLVNNSPLAIADAITEGSGTDASTIMFIPADSASADLTQPGIDGMLYIPADVVATGAGVKIWTRDGLSMNTEIAITDLLDKAIEGERLKQYNIANLDSIMDAVQVEVSMQTMRVGADGREEKADSSAVNSMLSLLATFILYMALILYGQMVMTSVTEEKQNRVLELIVTSVSPMRLMLGKIVGIGLVAATQILIWLVLILLGTGVLLPAMLPADFTAEMAAMQAGQLDPTQAVSDMGALQAIAIIADPCYIAMLFIYMLLFLIGGFLLYAAVYAAVGSAVDSPQDATQLQSLTIVPVILGMVFGMVAVSNPTSTLSVVTSYIPFTSPMVMMARIPFGVGAWEIWTSLVLLFAGAVGMIWIAAKVYRVGIFMHGKKPTVRDLVRWARQK